MQSLHSPRNFRETCCWSAFKCFVNETLLLKPAHSQNEKVFNTTLSRIQFSQRNVQHLLCNSESDCDKNCYPCANYPKQPETKFLEDFKTLLQRLYRRNNLEWLKNSLLHLKMSSGDKLYTPTNIEYLVKMNCERMAIKCFMKEVEVLEEENQDNKSITDIIRHIQKNIHAIWTT
ncbi:hypothetical protein L345_09748, partial [Ophiophagus hannah]